MPITTSVKTQQALQRSRRTARQKALANASVLRRKQNRDGGKAAPTKLTFDVIYGDNENAVVVKVGGLESVVVECDGEVITTRTFLESATLPDVVQLIEKVVKATPGNIATVSRGAGIRQFVKSLPRNQPVAFDIATEKPDELSASSEFDPYEAGRELVEFLKATEGGAYSLADLQKKLGTRTSTIHRKRVEHRIVYWRDASDRFNYPKWQFNENGAVLKPVREILQIFKSDDEWRIMSYLLMPREQLVERRAKNAGITSDRIAIWAASLLFFASGRVLKAWILQTINEQGSRR